MAKQACGNQGEDDQEDKKTAFQLGGHGCSSKFGQKYVGEFNSVPYVSVVVRLHKLCCL
jgi:hypothetical protein